MTDEQKNPQEETPLAADQNAETEADATPDVAPGLVDYEPEGEAESLPEPANAFEASVQDAMAAGEAAEDQNPVVEAFDEGVKAIVSATDVAPSELQHDLADDHDHDGHSDVVTLPYVGTIEVYGGIYTVIFGVLAVLTLLEVAVAEIFPSGFVSFAALMGAAIAKAILVIMFYMHLHQDNPIFRVVVALPLLIALLSVLYLIGVPTGSGLGYN